MSTSERLKDAIADEQELQRLSSATTRRMQIEKDLEDQKQQAQDARDRDTATLLNSCQAGMNATTF